MRKISIALLVAMVLAGLFAMTLADTVDTAGGGGGGGRPTDTCSTRGGHGQWSMCQRKKTYRCQCHQGYGWCYTENKCKKGYYSCTSERNRHQHKKKKTHKKKQKRSRSRSSSCSSRTRKINTCNAKCVKGTLVNTCSTPYGYGTYAALGGVNPIHKPQHPAKKVCKESCVCHKGWTGERCDRKRVKITYSKNLGKHCGKGTECTRVITVKCRCKKHKSRSSSTCSSSSSRRRRNKGHKNKNHKRKTSTCTSSRRRRSNKGHKKNQKKNHRRKTSTCTSSRRRRSNKGHKKNQKKNHRRKTSTCTSSKRKYNNKNNKNKNKNKNNKGHGKRY